MSCLSQAKRYPIISITGPTATGKTEVAFLLAKKIDAEIVSCDSMQIYKNISIGTAKPPKKYLKEIPHYLIDVVDVNTVFNAFSYAEMASECIRKIRNKGKNVVVSGGTGFYLKILFEGIPSGIGRNEEIRIKLRRIAQEKGINILYEKLERYDPIYAKTISENDLRRIIRALEVIEMTGRKFSEIANEKKVFVKDDYIIFCLNKDRSKLYNDIEVRVDKMIENGLIEEAKWLYENCNVENATIKQAIGYKELFEYFEGKISLNSAINLIKKRTRNYAKRQLTWFRKMRNVVWINVLEEKEDVVKKIVKVLEERLE